MRDRKDIKGIDCRIAKQPANEYKLLASTYFQNKFDADNGDEIKAKLDAYYIRYPMQFGDTFINASSKRSGGLYGRQYRRYMHIFPHLLERYDGSLKGLSVLDIGCSTGFWCIQARLAGAENVVGIDASSRNIEGANYLKSIVGMEEIEFRNMNAYEVEGEYDIVLFLGVLYHLDKPIYALEKLRDVTKDIAIVDTTTLATKRAKVKLKWDLPHPQQHTNHLSFRPSLGAVFVMLNHVGFKDVERLPNNIHSPYRYKTLRRACFKAI